MIRMSIATVVGLLVAAGVAWQLGGKVGAGVMLGFLLGAGMSGLGALYQRHILVTRPRDAFQGVAVSFGFKLVAMTLGALAFRYLEPAAARADWKSFLVAFAAAAALVMPFGAMGAAQAVRSKLAAASSPDLDSGRTV